MKVNANDTSESGKSIDDWYGCNVYVDDYLISKPVSIDFKSGRVLFVSYCEGIGSYYSDRAGRVVAALKDGTVFDSNDYKENKMSNKLKVKIKKIHPDAIMPTYATGGSAAFDLYACDGCGGGIIDTGIAFEIPEGYVMRIYSRSGHGFKYNVTLANSVGVIDSDYRGSVKVKLVQVSNAGPLSVNVGDRVAQAIIEPIPRVEFEWADYLSDTVRGDGGFGSTGK